MGQIITTQNLVAIKEVRHAGQWRWILHRILYQTDGLVQKRRNSSALAMELRLTCPKPSKPCLWGSNYLRQTRLISLPLMFWPLLPPGYQHPRHCQWIRHVLDLHETEFQTRVPFQCGGTIWNMNTFLTPRQKSAGKYSTSLDYFQVTSVEWLKFMRRRTWSFWKIACYFSTQTPLSA